MCKRAIEPRHGFWTMPAGFMENGESVQHAAAREAMEEALAHVEIGSLLAIVSVLRAHQVHIMFRARLQPDARLRRRPGKPGDAAVRGGGDSLAARSRS